MTVKARMRSPKASSAAQRARPRRRPTAFSRTIGGFGELLITVGILGILFVVWEVWWTGLDANRDMQEAEEGFYSSVDAGQDDPMAAGGDDGLDGREQCGTLPDGTAVPCPERLEEGLDEGGTMAMIYAPRLGESWAAPVREGVDQATLNAGGVGHYPQTQLPGEPGNFAVAGHRLTYGDILRDQDSFQTGDPLYVYSADGYYTYEVTESLVVQPHESEVLAPVPGAPGEDPEDASIMTLTTCHPLFSNRERLITHAELTDFTPLSEQPPDAVAEHLAAQDAPAAGQPLSSGLSTSSERGPR